MYTVLVLCYNEQEQFLMFSFCLLCPRIRPVLVIEAKSLGTEQSSDWLKEDTGLSSVCILF